MVSVSPRLPNLDSDEEPESTDPRFGLGFRSLSIDSAGYSDHDPYEDERAFAATPDSSASRRKRRQRQAELAIERAEPFRYETVADGNAFRLVILQPGTGISPIQCNLIWEDSRLPQRDYCCLSYAWESTTRDAGILCDGFRMPVTANLLSALQNLRRPKTTLLIWIDQICINQDNDRERGHQVSIMKNIFNRAAKVYIWLGDADDRSDKLCEYARKLRRSDDNPKSVLNRIISVPELKDAVHKLLQRPWFQRAWVIPEVALSRRTKVVIGSQYMTWESLVRLVRDMPMLPSTHFEKHRSLLGNTRQRIAIITQMVNSQKEALAHTDLTQLLILAKSSKASDVRDMVYAFYGLTLLTTFPDYTKPAADLYIEIILLYIENLLWVDSYSSWHNLQDDQRIFQLTSILYSAGALHQTYPLPSWVPDWTYAWHLAPIWCKTTPNFTPPTSQDNWTRGVRTAYRAGGTKLETFEADTPPTLHRRQSNLSDPTTPPRLRLRISAVIFDSIAIVDDHTPASTPTADSDIPSSTPPLFHNIGSISTSPAITITGTSSATALAASKSLSASPAGGDAVIWAALDEGLATLQYGRHFFTTGRGRVGLATPGVRVGDVLALVPGGDVPVVLRKCAGGEVGARGKEDDDDADEEGSKRDIGTKEYVLLCEAFVQAHDVMYGELYERMWTAAEDIMLV